MSPGRPNAHLTGDTESRYTARELVSPPLPARTLEGKRGRRRRNPAIPPSQILEVQIPRFFPNTQHPPEMTPARWEALTNHAPGKVARRPLLAPAHLGGGHSPRHGAYFRQAVAKAGSAGSGNAKPGLATWGRSPPSEGSRQCRLAADPCKRLLPAVEIVAAPWLSRPLNYTIIWGP